MRKRWIRSVILSTSLLIAVWGMSACSSGTSSTASADTSALEKKIVELENENKALKAKLEAAEGSNDTDRGNQAVSEEEPVQEVVADKTPTLEANKAVTVDKYAEVTLLGSKFKKKVTPPNPDSFYTYYEVKENENIYLDTVIKVKSLLTIGKSADEFLSVDVLYDGQYEYGTFSTIEDRGGADFTYTNITRIEPLKSGVIHFLAEVPEDISKDDKPVMIKVKIEDQEYTFQVK